MALLLTAILHNQNRKCNNMKMKFQDFEKILKIYGIMGLKNECICAISCKMKRLETVLAEMRRL